MFKVILAALLAAVLLFCWNFVSWTILPFHNLTIHPLNIAPETASLIQQQHTRTGVYYYPPMPESAEASATEEFMRQHEAGPVMSMMVLLPKGAQVMAPLMFVWSLVFYFIAALVGILLLNQTRGAVAGYGGRVVYFVVLGLFASLVADVPLAIWMYVPVAFTIVMMLDHVIGWFLAGLAIAALIKPARKTL